MLRMSMRLLFWSPMMLRSGGPDVALQQARDRITQPDHDQAEHHGCRWRTTQSWTPVLPEQARPAQPIRGCRPGNRCMTVLHREALYGIHQGVSNVHSRAPSSLPVDRRPYPTGSAPGCSHDPTQVIDFAQRSR